MAEIEVLKITITPIGLAIMAKEGVLEVLQEQHQKMRIYAPLHTTCRSVIGDLIYTVELHETTSEEAMMRD